MHLYELLTALIASDIRTSGGCKLLDKTSVPITKTTHHQTDVRVTTSFNMTNAVNIARLIETYMDEYSSLSKLVLVLKQFLLQCD